MARHVYGNIMIDIETLGTAPGCAILEIGAIAFGRIGYDGSTPPFFAQISLNDCVAHGLTIDPTTLIWWNNQDRKIPLSGADTLFDSLMSLAKYVQQYTYISSLEVSPPLIWSKPPTFDVMILEAAFKSINHPVPWSFRRVRDLKTLMQAAGVTGEDEMQLAQGTMPRVPLPILWQTHPHYIHFDTKHHPLGDARLQVDLASIALKRLEEGNKLLDLFRG